MRGSTRADRERDRQSHAEHRLARILTATHVQPNQCGRHVLAPGTPDPSRSLIHSVIVPDVDALSVTLDRRIR